MSGTGVRADLPLRCLHIPGGLIMTASGPYQRPRFISHPMRTDDYTYLDHAATTPVRPAVRAAMEPFLSERFGNPSSVHAAGRAARQALEEARERVAACIGARRTEIVFTGGGTEADNLALLGRWRRRGGEGGGVAVSAVEHSAVRNCAARLAGDGAAVITLAVDEDGRLDLGALDEALTEPLSVVSVMWANNEVGVLQPVEEIAARCAERGVVFHTDAVQAAGHVPVRVDRVPCGLLSMSAHKIGGPKGVGALFVRSGTELDPVLVGGGQESGLRAGTSNVAGAVGLAEALEQAVGELEAESRRLRQLRDGLEAKLMEQVPGLVVNGARAPRVPHVLSAGLEDAQADALFAALDIGGLAVSAGSACQSGTAEPSHVLVAMGARQDATIRFSFGWSSTPADAARAADVFIESVGRVRAVRA